MKTKFLSAVLLTVSLSVSCAAAHAATFAYATNRDNGLIVLDGTQGFCTGAFHAYYTNAAGVVGGEGCWILEKPFIKLVWSGEQVVRSYPMNEFQLSK